MQYSFAGIGADPRDLEETPDMHRPAEAPLKKALSNDSVFGVYSPPRPCYVCGAPTQTGKAYDRFILFVHPECLGKLKKIV